MARASVVVRRYLDIFGGGDLALLEEVVANARLARAVRHWRSAFPDLTLSTTVLVEAADHVTVHITGEGTHEGSFLGAPPTGRRWEAGCVAMYRVEEGRIADFWVSWDLLNLALQLGLIEEPFPG